jgi:hypothetical protein
MSHTTVLGIPKEGGELVVLGRFSNSHRGVMWVWYELSKKYLGLRDDERYRLIMDPTILQQLVDLAEDERLSDAEHYALDTSWDNVLVGPSLMLTVADALENFEPGTENLKGQAEVIRKAHADGCKAICWHQTSVSQCPWEIRSEDGEESRMFSLETYNDFPKAWFMAERGQPRQMNPGS